MTTTQSNSNKQETLSNKKLYHVSLLIYASAIIITSILLVIEPNGFNARTAIVPLLTILFVSGLGIGKFLGATPTSKLLSRLGAISLATLLTFIGFFIVAATGWFVALSHA